MLSPQLAAALGASPVGVTAERVPVEAEPRSRDRPPTGTRAAIFSSSSANAATTWGVPSLNCTTAAAARSLCNLLQPWIVLQMEGGVHATELLRRGGRGWGDRGA